MIAKRSPRRKDGKSSFGALAKYILDAKAAGEKVDFHSITNCENSSIEWAIDEITATQNVNTRTKGDKTYHLIVSFPPGEKLTKDQLTDIEYELCKSIGLKDHQRISAVHTDTQNQHIHIAINKIHPLTHNMVEPYYDHYKLMEVCQQLELKHGLEPTQHGTPGKPGQRKQIPVDELRAGGITPLADFLKDRLNVSMIHSWQSVHDFASSCGCELAKRGNGLVFVDASGVTVKASAIDRQLSLNRLAQRIGAFEVNKNQHVHPKRAYSATPGGADRTALWGNFQDEKTKATLLKREAITTLKEMNKANKKHIGETFKEKRNNLKHGQLIKNSKDRKGWYSILKLEKAKQLEATQRGYREALAKLHERHAFPDWRDWLSKQAQSGNMKALDTLQSARPKATNGNAIHNDSATVTPFILDKYKYHIHRNGDVSYKLKDGGFTDEGKRIRLGKEPSAAAIEAALRMATMKYGTTLNLAGTAEFRASAAMIAKQLGITIRNADNTIKTPINEASNQHKTIAAYIKERNEKRKSLYDILKHRLYEPSDKGDCELAGVRTFDSQKAVLIKRHNEILLKPITDQEAKQLSALKVGQHFLIDETGRLRTGRSL